MRCCACGNGCEASMRNLREGGTQHEKKMDLDGSASDSGDTGVHRHRRRNRAASVELAAAAALRLAGGHVLASARDTGAVPHPVRRTWSTRVWPVQFPPAHGREVPADDAGGARAIPAADAGTLRLRPARGREQGAMREGTPMKAAMYTRYGPPEVVRIANDMQHMLGA